MTRTAKLLLIAAFALSGCGSVFEQPEVTLAGFRPGGIGLTGGLIYVQLRIVNPNGFDLRADELKYDLDVADPNDASKWIDFAAGTFDEELRVPGDGEATVEIPIEFTYDAVGGIFRSIMNKGTFNYRATGEVMLEDPVTRTIPFKKAGVLSLAGSR